MLLKWRFFPRNGERTHLSIREQSLPSKKLIISSSQFRNLLINYMFQSVPKSLTSSFPNHLKLSILHHSQTPFAPSTTKFSSTTRSRRKRVHTQHEFPSTYTQPYLINHIPKTIETTKTQERDIN